MRCTLKTQKRVLKVVVLIEKNMSKKWVAKVKGEKKNFVMQLAWKKGSQMCEVPVLKTNP